MKRRMIGYKNNACTMRILNLIFMMIISGLPIVAYGFSMDVVINGVKYEIFTKEQTATAVGLVDADYTGALIIPGSVEYEGNNYSVTSVLNFSSCNGITSLTIGDGVKTISSYAFYNCRKLASISLPESIEDIGEKAFHGTTWYDNEPNGVVYLENIAYTYKGENSDISEVTIRQGTTIISSFCFFNAKIKTVHLPNTLEFINHHAFAYSSLQSIELNSVKVRAYSFCGCLSLKDVILNDVVFYPDDMGSITSCFSGCDNIENVTINCPLVQSWFASSPSVKNVIFGEKVNEICDGAFYGCTNLTTLHIPGNVKTIRSAFENCSNLKTVNLSYGLKTLKGCSFGNCSNLTEIVIPNSVDSIGDKTWLDGTFAGCSGLTTIVLPMRMDFIGNGTFNGCNNLKEIVLPEGLSTINEYLFVNCSSLESVIIPSTVKSIQRSAFERCKEIKDIYCYAPVAPEVNSSAFMYCGIEYVTLHVPEQAVDCYKVEPYWKDFKEIVGIPNYEVSKCAKPVISYEKGQLKFFCETEGAEFISEITDTDIQKSNKSTIDLTVTYHISVYAVAPNCVSSDTARATLCWVDAIPEMEVTEKIKVEDVHAFPILIQSIGGHLFISGSAEDLPISIYDITGKMIGSARMMSETISIPTLLRPGDIAIIKIGEKRIKVMIR